jgi:hypothetical protein
MEIGLIFQLCPIEIGCFFILLVALRPPPSLFDQLLHQLTVISSSNRVDKPISWIVLNFLQFDPMLLALFPQELKVLLQSILKIIASLA